MRELIWHKYKFTIRPLIHFSLIVNSRLNLLLELTSNSNESGFLIKETVGAFDVVQIHDWIVTSQTSVCATSTDDNREIKNKEYIYIYQ